MVDAGEEVASNLTLKLPIRNSNDEAPMKNISFSTPPNFHGLTSEDLGTFLFEFDFLCRSFDYIVDAHKLNLFPATLKDVAL